MKVYRTGSKFGSTQEIKANNISDTDYGYSFSESGKPMSIKVILSPEDERQLALRYFLRKALNCGGPENWEKIKKEFFSEVDEIFDERKKFLDTILNKK